MKKMYLIPALQAEETQTIRMIAESLKISNDSTVDGDKALMKEDNAWDIWDEE